MNLIWGTICVGELLSLWALSHLLHSPQTAAARIPIEIFGTRHSAITTCLCAAPILSCIAIIVKEGKLIGGLTAMLALTTLNTTSFSVNWAAVYSLLWRILDTTMTSLVAQHLDVAAYVADMSDRLLELPAGVLAGSGVGAKTEASESKQDPDLRMRCQATTRQSDFTLQCSNIAKYRKGGEHRCWLHRRGK